MQLLHTPAALSASFDEPNLLVSAGLVPAVRLAEKVGLPDLAAEQMLQMSETSVLATLPASPQAQARASARFALLAGERESLHQIELVLHGLQPADGANDERCRISSRIRSKARRKSSSNPIKRSSNRGLKSRKSDKAMSNNRLPPLPAR